MTILITVLAAVGLIAALLAAFMCKRKVGKPEVEHNDSLAVPITKSMRINESINETDYDRNASA